MVRANSGSYADTIKQCGVAFGIRVDETGSVGLAEQVGGHTHKLQRCRQIRAPLQKISHALLAEPTDVQVGLVKHQGQHAQSRDGIGWAGAAAPFLPVVHSVSIRVRVICRSVYGQPVLIKPLIRDGAGGRLELESTEVYTPALNSRIAVKVRHANRGGVDAGVDGR